MIKKILEIIEDVTMTKGVFLQDKSFKYDTVFFNANFLLEHTIGDKICLGTEVEKDIISKFEKTFNLSANSDANKNYFLEGSNLLAYANIIKKDEDGNYEILHRDVLEFVASSIENAYILLYLLTYKAFINDGIWETYIKFLNAPTKENKESILKTLRTMICSKSESVGKVDSVWAGLKTKYPLMVLGLANKSNVITRGDDVNPPKIKEQIITPQDVSANVRGTRTTTVKDNDYIKSFRLTYVISQLSDYLATSSIEIKVNFDNATRITGGTNVILYGVPGAGKSHTIKTQYCNDESYMERLVFHPDYTYSDFVGQILPKLEGDGNVTYVFNPGPFTKIVRKAYINPDKMFFLVIEEINRGNAPAIFGDIFQLLDRDEKGSSEYAITNADIATVVYENENHKVKIPSNLTILCTMNTSDQNVFTLDTAFQRRWNMRLIQNKFSDEENERKFAETKILDTDVTWEKFFTEINNIILKKNIRMTSSEDKRLGTHFVKVTDLEYVEGDIRQNSMFAEKVLKYLWDDAFKFNHDEIFDLTKVDSLEKVIENFVGAQGNSRFISIFKQNIYDAIVPKKAE